MPGEAQPFPWMAAATVGGGILGNIGARKRANRQFQHNKKLAEYSYDRQYQMWDEAWRRETEYNDPSAQMQRYRDAGINPHMAYMNGGGQNTAQTGALPQYNQQPNEVGPSLFEGAGNMLEKYASTKQILASVRKTEAEARITEAQAKIEEKTAGLKLDSTREQLRNESFKNWYEYKKLGLRNYAKDAHAGEEYQQLMNMKMKVDMELANATKSNLISNDRLIEAQTKIAEGQTDFMKEDWYKELPGGLKALISMFMSRMAGIK